MLRAYDTRDQLLQQLASQVGSEDRKNPLVVMLGAEKPRPRSASDWVDRGADEGLSTEDRIRTRMIFLSMLEEVTAGRAAA